MILRITFKSTAAVIEVSITSALSLLAAQLKSTFIWVTKVIWWQQSAGYSCITTRTMMLLGCFFSLQGTVDYWTDSLVCCNWPVASNWCHLSSYRCNDLVIYRQFIALTLTLCDEGQFPSGAGSKLIKRLSTIHQNKVGRTSSWLQQWGMSSSAFWFISVQLNVRIKMVPAVFLSS